MANILDQFMGKYRNSPLDPEATDDAPIFQIPVAEEDPEDSMPALEDAVTRKPGALASDADITKMKEFPLSPAEQMQQAKLTPGISDADIEKEIMDSQALDLPAEEKQMQSPEVSQASKYKQLLDQYKGRNRDVAILSGVNKALQGMATAGGGKIDDGSEQVKLIQGMNQDPLKQIQSEDAATMADSSSDVSKFYRQQAYAMLKKLYPDKNYEGTLENMSASQLAKLPGMSRMLGGSNSRTLQQSQFISKTSGDPLQYDPNTGTYTNAITGKPVASGDAVRPVAYNDAFGNRQYVSPTGNLTVQSSKRVLETPQSLADQASTFTPDKEQRGAFDKEKGRIDTLTKTVNEKLSAANRILGALDGDSKQAMAVIKTQMPRLAGEVGNLNQSEQEVWQGSQAWLDRAMQFLEKGTTSELTPENKEELRKVLGIFLDDAVKSRDSIMDASSNSLEKVYNIPADFTKSAYGVIKPLGERAKAVSQGDYKDPAKLTSNNKDLVTIQGPSGQTVKMSKEAAQKYLSKPGYKEVQ